jgi:hypothetical protein
LGVVTALVWLGAWLLGETWCFAEFCYLIWLKHGGISRRSFLDRNWGACKLAHLERCFMPFHFLKVYLWEGHTNSLFRSCYIVCLHMLLFMFIKLKTNVLLFHVLL